MSIILRSRNFWIGMLLSILFWGVAPWLPRSAVFDIVNALSIACCTGVIVMYYPSVAKSTGTWFWVFLNNLSGAHYFVIGLLGLLAYVIARHAYQQVWRWAGKPDWMIEHLVLAYIVYGTVILAVMHLLARDMEEGQIPRENWRWTGIITAAGLALAILFVTFFDPGIHYPIAHSFSN